MTIERVKFSSFIEASEPEREELAPARPPARVYPEVPMVYPGRPSFCVGCAKYADYLHKSGRPRGQWEPRPPIHGEANCPECKAREQLRREQDRRAAE